MLSETTDLLVQLVASTDALWLPLRGPFRMARAQVREERRRQFHNSGIDLCGGGTAAERMAYSRSIDTAEAAGLVQVNREGGKRAGVRLTMLGDTIARTLVARHTVWETWPQFEAACDLDRRAFGRGLPEHVYVGVDAWPGTAQGIEVLVELIKQLESASIPWQAFGWFRFTMDGTGHGWCAVTPEGHEARAAGCPPPPPAGVEFSNAAGDVYDGYLRRAEEEMDGAPPDRPSDLVIPLPGGCGWGWTDPTWFEAPK